MCDGTRADENKRYHEKSSISACFLQGKLKYDFLQEINSLHHKPFPSDKKKIQDQGNISWEQQSNQW